MPHESHGIANCSHRFRRKGRQLQFGESRSPTQIVQWKLVPTSHRLWAYVCRIGLGLIEIFAMVMAMATVMAMAMVLVIVIMIIVPEVLRQVGSLHQHQHQSFYRL